MLLVQINKCYIRRPYHEIFGGLMCSKKNVNEKGAMVFNVTFNNISGISWRLNIKHVSCQNIMINTAFFFFFMELFRLMEDTRVKTV